MISLIVACDENRGIGLNGRIPWFIPGELKWVSDVTRHTVKPNNTNALIMGRNTWESLPEGRRPLPGRISIVVSSQAKSVDKLTLLNTTSDLVWVADSLERAISMADGVALWWHCEPVLMVAAKLAGRTPSHPKISDVRFESSVVQRHD